MSDVITPAEPVAETSLADHEQTFGANPAPASVPQSVESDADDDAQPDERDESGRFKPRRAKSQHATAADVEAINAYTKRLREAEEAIGVKVEKKDGESERVYQIRRRAELAEAVRDARKVAHTPPPPAPVTKPDPKPFAEKEPRYEDFENEPDQYQAHMRALAAYDRRKEAHEQGQTQAKTEYEKGIEARNAKRDQFFKENEDQHFERMQAYHTTHPEAQAILDAVDAALTPAIYAAIITAENSPQLLMRVAQDQDLRDDLIDLTEGKSLSKDLVARVQRRLNRGLADDTTGASAIPPKPVPTVPRPPTPVRTGPMKASDTPPGDEDSLAAHEKFYGGKRW